MRPTSRQGHRPTWFRRQRMLKDGVCGSIEELARRERVGRAYMSRMLRLTLLAPELVEAILDGRQPAEMQLDDLLVGVPVEWELQCQVLTSERSRFRVARR